MAIKEYTCLDEHWVLYGSVESLYCTPETNVNNTVCYLELKLNFFLKKKNEYGLMIRKKKQGVKIFKSLSHDLCNGHVYATV